MKARKTLIYTCIREVSLDCQKNVSTGAAAAYWLGRRIQDRNDNFERDFDSRWWILFLKFEIFSQSCTITAVIIYRSRWVQITKNNNNNLSMHDWSLPPSYLLLRRLTSVHVTFF